MACGGCAAKTAKVSFVHTAPDGKTQVYQTEVEAKGAVRRKGGTYKRQ